MRPFTLHRPETLAAVGDLLAQHGDDAMLYAGGTELLLAMKEGLLRPRHLIDVKRIPGLDAIGADDGGLTLGATTRHRDVERSELVHERCGLVAGVARHVANVRVRNVGTIGGNLAFADPHSDLATLFVTLDARVRLWAAGAEREVPLADFIRGAYETAREEHEVLTAVRLPAWPAGTVATYLKFGVYERPTLGVSVALLPGAGPVPAALRLTVGCIGPRPQRLRTVEDQGTGETPAALLSRAEELAAAAARDVEAAEDAHGSAEYKRDMTRVFVGRALRAAAARAQGQEIQARYAHTVIV